MYAPAITTTNSARRRGWKGTPWTCRITTAPAAAREGATLDALDHHHSRPRRGWKGTPYGRARITTTSTARRGGMGRPERARISPPRPPCAEEGGTPRTRRDHHSRPQPRKDGTRPDQHSATPAMAEGEGVALCRIIPRASTPRGKGRHGRAQITTSTARRVGRGRHGRAGSPQRQHGTGTPSGPLLPPVLIYLFVFPSALLALASEHKKAAHQGRPYPY